MAIIEDDPAAVLASMPTFPPVVVRKPVYEISMELKHVDPVLADILMYGQSPGPQFPLGEN